MNPQLPVRQVGLPPERRYNPITRSQWAAGVVAAGAGVGALGFLVASMAFGVSGLVPLVGGYAAFLWWSVDRRRRAQHFVRENDDAVAWLNAGDVDRAEAVFERLIDESRSTPGYHALFVYNRAVAFLRRGQFDRAISLFHAVLESGWLNSDRMPFRALVFGGLSTAHALRGDLASAQQWLVQAHEVISDAKRGALLVADVAVALRQGRAHDALAMMDAGWTSAEGVLSPMHLHTLRLLRAFALEHLPPSPQRDAEVHHLVSSVYPHPGGAFDHIGAAWPEFRAFLAAKRLSPPAPY